MQIDQRVQRAAEKLERAKSELRQAKQQATALRQKQEAREREERRRAETRRKIETGGLVSIAGLLDVDRGVLLGGLLALADVVSDPQRAAGWKRRGDDLLRERGQARRPTSAAQ